MGVLSVHIVDGAKHFRAGLAQVVRHQDSPHTRLAVRAGLTIPRLPDGVAPDMVAPGPPLPARLNHNRWIVDCPECNGAEFVWPDELFMWCAGCHNAAVGHKWRAVKMPANREAIEQVIRVRPLPQNRNWEPGETLTALRKQNRDRGLPEEV